MVRVASERRTEPTANRGRAASRKPINPDDGVASDVPASASPIPGVARKSPSAGAKASGEASPAPVTPSWSRYERLDRPLRRRGDGQRRPWSRRAAGDTEAGPGHVYDDLRQFLGMSCRTSRTGRHPAPQGLRRRRHPVVSVPPKRPGGLGLRRWSPAERLLAGADLPDEHRRSDSEPQARSRTRDRPRAGSRESHLGLLRGHVRDFIDPLMPIKLAAGAYWS